MQFVMEQNLCYRECLDLRATLRYVFWNYLMKIDWIRSGFDHNKRRGGGCGNCPTDFRGDGDL